MNKRARSTLNRLCVETACPSGVGSSIRDATPEEVRASAMRKAKLKLLRKERDRIDKLIDRIKGGCKHRVIYDEYGWPSDVRICHACGAHLGSI